MADIAYFRLEVSEEVSDMFHTRFRDESGIPAAFSKSTLAVLIISEGMKSSSTMLKSESFIKDPKRGSKIIQIKRDENKSFFLKLEEFTKEKNFHTRKIAARYCLYKGLGDL